MATGAMAQERTRRLRRGVGAALPARAAQALAPLILIPWLLEYLGLQLYGFWMATTALMGMLAFSDLGLGNAVMSRLPSLLASRKLESARALVTGSYALLFATAAGIGLITTILARWAPLEALFGLGPGTHRAADVRGVFLVTCFAFLANIPLGLVFRVQFARERSSQAYLISALAAVASVPLTLLGIRGNWGPVAVVGVNLAVVPFANLLYSGILFSTALSQIRPSPRFVRWATAREALAGGFPFLVLTGLLTAVSGIDYLMIGRLVGAAEVAEFSVPARLLAQLGVLVSLMNMPFWSASAAALAHGDIQWVDATRHRLMMLGVTVTGLGLLLLLGAAGPLYRYWLGDTLPLSLPLVGGLGAWWMLQAVVSPTFMVQNGLTALRPQFLGFTGYLAISVPLKLAIVPDKGIEWVGWISTGCFALTVAPAALYGYVWATRRFHPQDIRNTDNRTRP